MALIRKYMAFMLLILFCWYYTGSNFSSHLHVINGKSIAHSHPGAAEGHSHSTKQLATIDLLTHFQSEEPVVHYSTALCLTEVPESKTEYRSSAFIGLICFNHKLRGPPQIHLS